MYLFINKKGLIENVSNIVWQKFCSLFCHIHLIYTDYSQFVVGLMCDSLRCDFWWIQLSVCFTSSVDLHFRIAYQHIWKITELTFFKLHDLISFTH